MKRVIKFRAYTEISNEVLGMKYDVPHNYNETVMQFTGLLDKNGKEIYEGDILPTIHDNSLRTIEFHPEYGFLGNFPEGWISHKYEIIGNIYENSNLIQHD